MTFSVREVPLGEVCEIKQGRYLAPNQMEPSPTNECFVPVIGGNGVLGYTDQSTFPFPVPLVTCRGSKCGLMQWAEPPTWISNNAMAVYFKENKGDNFFLHQYLLNSSFDDVTTGSAQPQITVTNLSLKQILLPDLQTQKTISLIMKNIEGKIATNNVLSKTLEDIAQTIFKSWFIDFDPVKAKTAGERPVGMDDATAALFPDSMGESELGFIPNSWEVAPIGEVLVVGGGTTPSTTNAEYWDGEHCWTTPKDLSSQRGLITTSSIRKISDLGLAQISSGLLPVNSVLMSCRAPIGYVSINAVPTAVNQGFITLKNSAEYHPIYLLNWINANIQEIHNRAGGATFAEITRKAFREIPFLKPSPQVVKRYSEIVEPIMLELEQLTRQIENLQVVRDLLLPRLVSGELQIPEEMLAS
jgi:type I restriction enzyme, S subunit